MQRLSGVVILYNPGSETVENILSYLTRLQKLYVIDNSKNKSSISNGISMMENVNYLHDGQNEGMAKRLNQACKLAIEDGFEWLLTMDQDSFFSQENISAYTTCLEKLSNKEQIAMTGVEYLAKKDKGAVCKVKETTSLITSGSIVNLKLFEQIGGFDEALFIDQVDFEYCYRSISKGFKIIQYENIFLEHALGESSVHKSLKTFKSTSRSLHSPVRLYYMSRNYFYIKSKYKQDFRAEVEAIKKDLYNRIKNNLLYNKNRLSALKFLILGFIDYKRNKMGKISY